MASPSGGGGHVDSQVCELRQLLARAEAGRDAALKKELWLGTALDEVTAERDAAVELLNAYASACMTSLSSDLVVRSKAIADYTVAHEKILAWHNAKKGASDGDNSR